MKVVAGHLRDADRQRIFDSNRLGRRLVVAALRATVTYDQRRLTPYTRSPMQAVGVATTWDHDTVSLGGWSFTTMIRWDDIVGVWWREEAPSQEQVDALLAEYAADAWNQGEASLETKENS